MTAPDPFGLADYGDEFDAEIREIQERREATFVFRFGMNATSAIRREADKQRAADLARLGEIGRIRKERTLPKACLWCRVPQHDLRALKPCLITPDHEHEFVPVRTF